MKTKLFLAFVILSIIGCDKPTYLPPAEIAKDKRVLRLDEISATAPSGADISYFFTYKDSVPIQVVLRNNSIGVNNERYVFNYDGTRLSSIDAFYLNTNSDSIPDIKLTVYYSNNKISKIEFWYEKEGALTLGNYIKYIYDLDGRMITKNAYEIESGIMQLFLINQYTYGYNNNIVGIFTQGQGLRQGYSIKFENSFSSENNNFFKNNPTMSVFMWYLFDLNQLSEGLLDIHIFSPKNAISTKQIYNGITKNYNFNMFLGNDNLWDNSYDYPNVYSTNDKLFQKIRFIYKLMP